MNKKLNIRIKKQTYESENEYTNKKINIQIRKRIQKSDTED